MNLFRLLGSFTLMGVLAVSCGGGDETKKAFPGAGGAGGAGGSAGKGGTAGKSGSGGSNSTGGKGGTGGAAGSAAAGSAGEAGASGEAGGGGMPGEGGAAGESGSAGEGGASGQAGAAGDGGSGGEGGGSAGTPVFTSDLDDQMLPPELDPGTGLLTPSQGFGALGFGDGFLRSATNNVVTLTLTNLPPHTTLSIDMLFAAIDSLDGTGTFPAGDFFKITLDGQQIFRESFANAIVTQIQSYVPPPGVELARRVDLGFQGPGGYYTDSAYDFSKDPTFHDIPHTASTAVIVFTLEGEGVQDLLDESWAIDNLNVTVR